MRVFPIGCLRVKLKDSKLSIAKCIIRTKKIKADEATRSEDKKIFGFSFNNIITCVILTAITLGALCDIISHLFGSIKKSKLHNASRRRRECLVLCLTLYVVFTLSLFWKRFEVSIINYIFQHNKDILFVVSSFKYLILSDCFIGSCIQYKTVFNKSPCILK